MLKRPTLLGLMVLIAYLAVGMAAIRSDTEIWAGVVMYLTVLILCSATLVALHRRGAWAGFAIFGWAYFLILDPNAAERSPVSVSMEVAHALVQSFTHANVPEYSLRSGLSLVSVAMGLLGAVVGWRIGREAATGAAGRAVAGGRGPVVPVGDERRSLSAATGEAAGLGRRLHG